MTYRGERSVEDQNLGQFLRRFLSANRLPALVSCMRGGGKVCAEVERSTYADFRQRTPTKAVCLRSPPSVSGDFRWIPVEVGGGRWVLV